MSSQPTRTLAAIFGAALLVWSADAGAHPGVPFGVTMTPSWWTQSEAPDLVSQLPRAPLDPLELFAPSGTPRHERWYEGESDSDRAEEATGLSLPCGLFLDAEPRLTLFDDPRWWEPPSAAIATAWHTDKTGEIIEYDQIPRRWDLPMSYDAYRYPVATYPGWAAVTSGYDLDLPDEEQRRGTMRAVGHGGVDLPQAFGTKITMMPLAQQVGDAKVVHIGTLFGNSVVTLHAIREGGERRHYLLIFGHLDREAPGLKTGDMLRTGEVVGFVGDSESPEFVHLHLEVRRVRDGVDPATLTGYRFLARDATVVTDPRNVLPTKPLPRSVSCKERRSAKRRASLDADLRLELEPWAHAGLTP